VPEQPTDPGNVFLQWLESLLLPDWGGLMNLLPILLILGMLGPALTLLAIYWFYVRVTTRRGRVRIDDPEPAPAPRDAAGEPVYPANVPYCPTHAMIYPPNGQTCEVDGEELRVRCPVDQNVRVASQQICRTCGTRYQLGASLAPVTVRRRGRPPEGGAAVA